MWQEPRQSAARCKHSLRNTPAQYRHTQSRNTPETRRTEEVPRGEGLGLGEKGEGIKKYQLAVTKQSRGCKHSAGNTVSDGVITACGARRGLETQGDHSVKQRMV